MNIKNKILSGITTMLVVGSVTLAGLNVKLPNTFYNNFDDGSIDASISDIAEKDFFDPHGDRLFIKRIDTSDYYQASKMVTESNNIKISLDQNLPKEYVEGATEAYKLYKKVFEIINPNITLEMGYFDYEDSNIYIRKVDKEKGNNLMTTSMLATGRKGYDGKSSLNREAVVSTITIYNIADSQSAKSTAFSFAHEFGHAFFGFDDYNKGYSFEEYGFESGEQPQTIMNYNDLYALETVSDTPKLTVLDVAMAVEQWGLFSNNGIQGENPFSSEEEYYEYIDSRLSEICYSDPQSMLAGDREAAYYGKISILDYINLKNENLNIDDNEDELGQ